MDSSKSSTTKFFLLNPTKEKIFAYIKLAFPYADKLCKKYLMLQKEYLVRGLSMVTLQTKDGKDMIFPGPFTPLNWAVERNSAKFRDGPLIT